MVGWKQYLFSVIVCAFSCKIVCQIVSDTKRKELLRMICGIVLVISLMLPLSRIKLDDILYVPSEGWNAADPYIAEGKRAVSEAQAGCIKVACEEYILNKAKTLGADIGVDIALSEDLIPVFAEITGEAEYHVQSQLQRVLTTDLGIPKEHQKWIWKQESNS